MVYNGSMSTETKTEMAGAAILARAAGREFVLQRKNDLETLWQEMLDDPAAVADERLPYWTELWPAALVLADWLVLQKKSIAGRACLDLGCGLGFLSLLGAWLGARMLGVDYEPAAIKFCALNARANGLAPAFALMDWRGPAIKPGSLDFIWGADIMYEDRFRAPIADFLLSGLAPAGRAWIAEPGRSFFAAFVRDLQERGLKAAPVFEAKADALYPQSIPVAARIWEVSRIAGSS